MTDYEKCLVILYAVFMALILMVYRKHLKAKQNVFFVAVRQADAKEVEGANGE